MSDILYPEPVIRKCKVCGEEKLHTYQPYTRHLQHACIDCLPLLPPAPKGQKYCARCLELIHHRKSYCKDCLNAYRRKRYTLEDGRAWNLLYHYDITPEEYDLMLFRQGGTCAICDKPETTFDKRIGRVRLLAVDHDHENGNVRGLLCSKCNALLGAIESDPVRFKALMKYKKGK